MKKRKFSKGPPIIHPMDLFDELMRGNYVYWHNKPQHPSWMTSMQFNSLMNAARRGILSYAIPNEERE